MPKRKPLKTIKRTLLPGTVLYHGTCELFQSNELVFPAWFSENQEVAEQFGRRSTQEKRHHKIHRFRVEAPLTLALFHSLPELEVAFDSVGAAWVLKNLPGANEDYSELTQALKALGSDGWIIPGNYPEGSDIVLTRNELVSGRLAALTAKR